MRRNATANGAGDSKGLIWGPGEHDTCHFPDYYFSTSMWTWRGMVEFSRWLNASSATSTGKHQDFADELAAEASAFAADIARALNVSISTAGKGGGGKGGKGGEGGEGNVCGVTPANCSDQFTIYSGYYHDRDGATPADEKIFTVPTGTTSLPDAVAFCQQKCLAWDECTSFVVDMDAQLGSYSQKCYIRRCEAPKSTPVQPMVNVSSGTRVGCVPSSAPSPAPSPGPGLTFVPPVVGRGTAPFDSMVESRRSSYSNFRYYAEMLSAEFMTPEDAMRLVTFRESKGGTLSGMTRFQDHLDDMPAIGYAKADAALDRVPHFNLLLFGHIANYQSRGTFHATEQLSLYGSAPSNFRDYYTLAEYDIDFCVPAVHLVARMVKDALVYSERDSPVVWLMKMAPRRWFSVDEAVAAMRSSSSSDFVGDGAIGGAGGAAAAVVVRNVMTRFGLVSFAISPSVDTDTERGGDIKRSAPGPLTITVDLSLSRRIALATATNEFGSAMRFKVRLRDPLGARQLVKVNNVSPAGSCPAQLAIDEANQTVDISISSAGMLNCSIVATLQWPRAYA
jgi:hypothetical protein